MYIKTFFQCQYCLSIYPLKEHAEAHELICEKNTAPKALCWQCGHLFYKQEHWTCNLRGKHFVATSDLLIECEHFEKDDIPF